jgi:hypothetical protein
LKSIATGSGWQPVSKFKSFAAVNVCFRGGRIIRLLAESERCSRRLTLQVTGAPPRRSRTRRLVPTHPVDHNVSRHLVCTRMRWTSLLGRSRERLELGEPR